MGKCILELDHIEKSFGNTHVLRGISLKIEEGEFVTLLGPSGCGKTTTLRIISGLETPTSGRVFIDGADVTERAPNLRNVNTVFQNYALFPHMNVEKNIGYGLKLRRTPKKEIQTAVEKMLSLVKLDGYEKRMPHELSGGQRQRVAIARALVNSPKLLLLDEPLGALDLKLRREMQLELKRLQKQLGLTFIYITHDQEEALNMSDRIALMNSGIIEQLSSPSEIYDRPNTRYAAEFIGSANLITGKAIEVSDSAVDFVVDGTDSVMTASLYEGIPSPKVGDTVTVAVRSEYIEYFSPEQTNNTIKSLSAEVFEKNFIGGMLRISFMLTQSAPMLNSEIIASRQGIDAALTPGDKLRLTWKPEHAVIVRD